MLRGSRHDGIPNNQSARERDRQRERQKQERAQMLPNVDKDCLSANSQDLFHPPRQVKPSVDDPTSLEIKKSLGNFESVRPYMLENSSRRLIGVDQYTAGSASSGSNSSTPDKQQRLSLPPSGTGNLSTNNNKSSSLLPHRNFVQGPSSAGVPSAPSNTSTVNLFRPTSNPVQKVPLIPSQPSSQPTLLPPPASHHYNQVGNTSHPHRPTNSSGSSSLPSTHLNPHRNLNNSTPNYSHTHTNNSSASNSEVVVPPVPPVSEVVRSKVDRLSNSSSAVITDKSLRTSAPSAGVPNDKNLGSVSNNKPALQRADSQIELENMLREMMDVKPPLSAIPTPLKESPPKRFSQRRSSKEENLVQNMANNTVANIASSPKSSKMDSSGDSSSNGDSSSESDSEDSSSASQTGMDNPESIASKNIANTVNSPTRNWDLSTLMNVNVKKDNINMKGIPDSSALSKSPKDGKLRKNLPNSLISEDLPQDPPVKTEPSVTSTSVFGKAQSSSPLEPSNVGLSHVSKVPGKSPRRTPDTRPDPHIPAKAPPPSTTTVKTVTVSTLQASSQGPSLSGSSSEDEAEIPKKDPPPRVPVPEPRPPAPVIAPTARGAKRRKKSSSSSDRNVNKSEDDSSPETKSKSKKVVQDRNKHDMIGKLFRGRKKEKLKVESPNVVEKANTTSGTSSSGSSAKLTSSNRVSAKDSGRKSASTTNVITVTPPTSLVQNGELGASLNTPISASGGKKRDSSNSGSGKDTSAAPVPHGGKRRQKSNTTTIAAKSASVTTVPPPPASSVVRVKEETPGKLSPTSLICRIPLNRILRTPNSAPPTPANLKAPPPTKADKGGSASSGSVGHGHSGSREESTNRVRLHYDSSRVGSSSDQANDTHEKVPHMGPLGEEPVCSDSDRRAANNHSTYKRERRKSRSSQKKSKVKLEPDSHSKISKIEEDTTVACEVSSNVIGYTSSTYYPSLVSTTRTPPVEVDVAQAPDSSLNPPHLPSPVVQPQMQFYSYFDKIEHNDSDDYFSRGQEAYLIEAKRLKHKADREEPGLQAQASTYLEAGLYFILAGHTIEKERSMWSREAFTMYKDTLTLIRFIGSQFRTRQDNSVEAKITVLSLRCQSLLALKLFKMKMKETKEGAQYLNDHFQKTPPLDIPPMANSPQLSTPSPLSPTLSPAGSSGLLMGHTPSPHHPQQNHQVTSVSVSRSLYSQMFKHCSNTIHVITAHELWDCADTMIEKHHIQDFFISIDRIYGPLTLHTQLIDLVRYVRHGLGVLKSCSDLS